MENKEPMKKRKKLKEILSYFGFGFMLGLDLFVIYFLYKFRIDFFNTAIDFSRSIELGFVLVKVILIVGILVINLKSLKNVIKEWKKIDFIKKVETRKGEEEYKRMGSIKRLLFFWRANGARKWMDKYHEEFVRMQKSIGKIKGNETKELIKLKQEMIKGVLIWTEDFQIVTIKYNKKGIGEITNEPVTRNFLETLCLDEIYEDYLLKCVDTAERFVNGYSEVEKGETL